MQLTVVCRSCVCHLVELARACVWARMCACAWVLGMSRAHVTSPPNRNALRLVSPAAPAAQRRVCRGGQRRPRPGPRLGPRLGGGASACHRRVWRVLRVRQSPLPARRGGGSFCSSFAAWFFAKGRGTTSACIAATLWLVSRWFSFLSRPQRSVCSQEFACFL